MSINVAYFSNQFADKEGHGLSRYSCELYQALSSLDTDVSIMPVASWSSMEGERLSILQQQTGLLLLPWGRRATPLAWAFLNNPPIEHWVSDVDVVHTVAMGYPVATRKPLVVTVHDTGPLTHPEYFENTSPWIMKRSLVQTVRQADAIICVSQSTADEFVDYAGAGVRDRIRVVHEGVSESFFLPADPAYLDSMSDLPPAGTPFIMATGKISPRKNIQGLIGAMSKLSDKIPHHLVLVGGDGWGMDEVFKQLDKPTIRERVHFPGYVSDDHLRALYSAASLYVHPSLYEGFGLTVLEAMAVGCPVITSNVYSLPEVAGDAALLVDPRKIDEIAEAIEAVCSGEQLADELIQKGKERVKKFSWVTCADRVANVYRGVL